MRATTPSRRSAIEFKYYYLLSKELEVGMEKGVRGAAANGASRVGDHPDSG